MRTKQNKNYIYLKSYDIYKITHAEIESFSCSVFASFQKHRIKARAWLILSPENTNVFLRIQNRF